ncbi:MAG: hypothetical protein IPP79_14485 [Chitinophagaceae bacterium]|nr:hypothetical protein [Chitinophagaceae bacterium]
MNRTQKFSFSFVYSFENHDCETHHEMNTFLPVPSRLHLVSFVIVASYWDKSLPLNTGTSLFLGKYQLDLSFCKLWKIL